VTDLVVITPDQAREIAINDIRRNYSFISLPDFRWSGAEIPSAETSSNRSFLYTSDQWAVTVSFEVVSPEDRIFNVVVINDTYEFNWNGLVDAYGDSLEVSVELGLFIPTATKATDTPTVTQLTNTPIPTVTSLPTVTPTPTSTPTLIFTPTPTPMPCNAADFIEDVTIVDGTAFAPNADFTKIWRLENVGTCTWTTAYDLVLVDGFRMGAPRRVALPENVSPGESVDVPVPMSAPHAPGDYQGFWMLQATNGEIFGIGKDAEYSFWVSITVLEIAGDFEYDFSIQHCSAIWRSETKRLQCDDTSNPSDGFVNLLTSPEFENRSENEPALWVHPNQTRYGWIEGTYPAYTVRYGDVFKAWVGCMAGYDLCSVRFYLAYQAENGRIYTLDEWVETYDQQVTTINLNLSDLAGETVLFILGMEANTHNVEDAQGFWFVPRIERHAGGG
jgi:hypothetical protein